MKSIKPTLVISEWAPPIVGEGCIMQSADMKRVMLVTHCPPPVVSGVGVILKRLFKYFPDDSYVIFTSSFEGVNRPFDAKLPCKYYTARMESFFKDYTTSVAVREWIQVLPAFWSALKAVRREKVTSILVIPSVGNLLLVSCIISLIARVELSIYFLDLYACNKHFRLRRWLSFPIERFAVKAAKNIFVMSEALKEHYKVKYSIKPVVLPHPIEFDRIISNQSPRGLKDEKKTAVIVFTGYIYEYQIDSLQNLARAIVDMDSVELHIYTSRSNDYLIKMGVCGRNIIYKGFVEPEKIPLIQKKADILFLPMAFKPPVPEITKTASPGKLPEYLASGTPILVHAPDYAYISCYARKHNWGLVVDKPDIIELRRAVLKLIQDKNLCLELIENAKKTVQLHEARSVSKLLQEKLGIIKPSFNEQRS